jgi:hypothetical protein
VTFGGLHYSKGLWLHPHELDAHVFLPRVSNAGASLGSCNQHQIFVFNMHFLLFSYLA